MAITTNASFKTDNKLKRMVKEAGCPFSSINQLLVRNVCLMPDYQSNELPDNADGITNVDIYLHEAFVLEVDEKKNKITIKVSQLMEWFEPRIRANFSAVSKQNGIIKLSPQNVKTIWHPDLDMFTKDLHDWKSLYDPLLFQEVAVQENALLHNYQLAQNFTSLHAWKDWRATVFCQFDFSSFPLDTQHCAFLQVGTSKTMHPLLYPPQNTEAWKYKAVGFEITITHIGTFADENVTPENTTNTIGFNITLKRIIQPYLYKYYFPCIAIVVVSQTSFIIPLSDIPGRVALVVTQFLTLTNIFIHQMVRITFTI